MEAIEELFADIVASRPPGYFDATLPLLRKYCEVAVESRKVRVEHNALKEQFGPEGMALFDRGIALMDEMISLADILQLWPGDQDKPAPRMQ